MAIDSIPPDLISLDPIPLSLAQELLDAYGSPLYVYRADILNQTIRHISQAIPYAQTQFRFASVTNGNVSLLQIFRDATWGLHANTPGDIYLGLTAGFHPDRIVYSGSNLNRAEMVQVLNWGVSTLNLDSLSQLQLCCDVYRASPPSTKPAKLNLGFRLNEPSLTGDSRIGVRVEEFPEAIAIASQADLKIEGLHFYRGTGTNATQAFTQVIDTLVAIAQQLPDWKYLDFGGGFGYPYRQGLEGSKVAFDWEAFGKAIGDRLRKLEQPIELIIEPGRAAIAKSAILLTTVVSVKWQGEKQIVGVDTTVANLSVPSVHGGYREIQVLSNASSDPVGSNYATDVCGNTTYSRDYLGKNCQLPKLAIGDILAILDVGAYGYAMSSHFLHRLRPAEVLLENNSHRSIRDREGYSILLANQVFDREFILAEAIPYGMHTAADSIIVS